MKFAAVPRQYIDSNSTQQCNMVSTRGNQSASDPFVSQSSLVDSTSSPLPSNQHPKRRKRRRSPSPEESHRSPQAKHQNAQESPSQHRPCQNMASSPRDTRQRPVNDSDSFPENEQEQGKVSGNILSPIAPLVTVVESSADPSCSDPNDNGPNIPNHAASDGTHNPLQTYDELNCAQPKAAGIDMRHSSLPILENLVSIHPSLPHLMLIHLGIPNTENHRKFILPASYRYGYQAPVGSRTIVHYAEGPLQPNEKGLLSERTLSQCKEFGPD